MKLKDTGLTAQELKDMVNKYMIETYARFDFIAGFAKSVSSSFRISVEVIFPSFTENAISIAPFLPSALPENVPSGRAFGFEQAAITAIEIPDATIKTAAASEFRRFLCFIYSSEKFFAD